MSTSHKGGTKPDRESLMALHALLQIRSDNVAGTTEEHSEEDQKGISNRVKGPRKKAKRVTSRASTQEKVDVAQPKTTDSPNVGGQMPSLPGAVPFGHSACARTALKNLHSMNEQQLHGFLSLAASPAMSQSAAHFSAAMGALMQPLPVNLNQGFNASQRHHQSMAPLQFANPHHFRDLSNSAQPSSKDTPHFRGRDMGVQAEEHHPELQHLHGITPSTTPTTLSPAPDDLIRRAEVEAALKSKPQRGRKRENLSVLERLELTRTRNREHAKSTRVRKKQRYQELVDNESRLQSLQSADDLNLQRRQCAIKFVNIREQMLKNLRTGSSAGQGSSSNEEVTRKPAPSEDEESSSTVIQSSRRGSESFCDHQDSVKHSDDETPTNDKQDAPSKDCVDTKKAVVLKDVIENLSSFIFSPPALGTASWVRPEGVHALTGVTMMKRFDNSILSLLQQQFSDGVIPAVRYRVEGSFEGVAVNPQGTGFARVDLVIMEGDESRPQAQTLLSSILTMQFAPDSDKLIAVQWSILTNRLSPSSCSETEQRHVPQDCRSDSGESLGSQTVYPSVVSLEHNMSPSGSDSDQHHHHKERSNQVS